MYGSEVEGGTNTGGGLHGPGERCPAKRLGDDGSQKDVVLPRLTSETEETEEDKCAKDGSPPTNFDGINVDRMRVKKGPGDLEDAGVIRVSVSPGNPWVNTQ